MKWLTKRIYNRFDGFWLASASIVAFNQHFFYSAAIVICGCIISTALEVAADR